HLVAGAAVPHAVQRPYVDHARLGKHTRAMFLGEIEIVPVERVLGVVAAPHHAAAAAYAGGALGSIPAEVRIGARLAFGLALFRLQDRYVGPVESVAHADCL